MVKTALEMAYALISRKSYHSLELAKKLKEKGVELAEIAPIIEKLAHEGYLDDAAWESRFAEGFSRKGKGAHLLPSALQLKGLLPILNKVKGKVLEGEKDALLAQIQRFKGDLSDPNEKRKLFQRLQRKGFHIEQILDVL